MDRFENSRNRRQARREPQPGAPAEGGAGAPLVGMRPGSGMQAHRDTPRSYAHLRGRIPKGSLLRALVRTPGEDSQHRMAPILVGFSGAELVGQDASPSMQQKERGEPEENEKSAAVRDCRDQDAR